MAIINIVSLREGNQKEFDLYKKYVGTYVDKIYVLNDGADEKSLNHAEWIQAETVKEVLAEEDWVLVSDIYMRFSKTLLRELRELVKDPHVVAYSAAVNKCEKNFEEYIKGKGRTDIIFAANRIPFSVKLTDGISSIELEEEFRGRVLEISDGVYDFLLKEEEKAEGLTVQIPYEKTVLDNDKKRVLITNLFVQKYTGSELHVLSIAKQFVKRGYEVVVAVFSKAYPLLKYFEEIPEIHVVDCLEYKLPFTHYDIFFAQHYAVADWVILKNHITCDRLIVSKLGIYNSLETLPCFAEDADVLCCVSSESENQIIKELGEGHIIEKIENCVDDWFFEEFQGDKTAKLQSIAIISNHVQQEVLMAVEELRSRGIIVKLYGEQFESVLVTPKLLEPYDVVITIGKTVQYALACGTVPYVYDQFGGPGYLTENNFELARKYNFSGRGFQRKKANELASDIINNFEKAFIMRKKWNQKALEIYNMNERFNDFFSVLMQKPIKYRKMEEFYSPLEKERTVRYGEGIKGTLGIQNRKAKIYFDIGQGMSEMFTEEYEYVLGQNIELAIPVNEKIKTVRFDPTEEMCECYLKKAVLLKSKEKINIVPVNAIKKDNHDIFLNCDPQYLFSISGKTDVLIIEFCVKTLNEQTILEYYNRLQQKLHMAEIEINKMKDTKIWRLGEYLRKIKK